MVTLWEILYGCSALILVKLVLDKLPNEIKYRGKVKRREKPDGTKKIKKNTKLTLRRK